LKATVDAGIAEGVWGLEEENALLDWGMTQSSNWSQPVSLKKRFLWWFGIYFGAQLPLILWWPCILNYPLGLSPYVSFVLGYSNPFSFRTFGYGFYLMHFLLTTMFPSRKAFLTLMIILIIVSSLNTASCMRTLGPAWDKGLPNIQG
jgi:hypothetical protein